METRGMKRARLSGGSTNKADVIEGGPNEDEVAQNPSADLQVFQMDTRSMKRARLSGTSAGNRGSQVVLFEELLEQVFSYLSPQELKVIRQVSKDWNMEACRALRKRSSVFFSDRKIESLENLDLAALIKSGRQLGLPTPFQEFRGMLARRSSIRLLGNLLTSNKDFRVRITALNFMAIRLRISDARSLQRSLMKCAPHLRVLDFFADPYHFRFPNIRIMEHLNFPLLHSFGFMINDTSNQNSVDFLVSLINGSPKLRNLTVKYLYGKDKMLAEIYTRSNLKALQELTVASLFPFGFPQVLKDLMLVQINSLKMLRLLDAVGLGDQNTPNLMRIINKFSNSLQHLNLTFVDICPLALLNGFPKCPKLAQLELGELMFGSQFWSRVPALKRFECGSVHFDVENLEEEPRVEHSSLEEFIFKRYENVEADVGDKILHDTFPNMTSLVRK